MKLAYAGTGFLAATFVAACGQPSTPPSSDIKKIIGTNELVQVKSGGQNLPENLRPLINAFGMLESGCTVTHVGNGVLLTAGHCVPAYIPRGTETPCWGGASIHWNFRVGVENAAVSNCIRVLASSYNQDGDFAVLVVDNPPAEKIEVDTAARPNDHTQVTIFGHPQKRALEWSQFCSVQAAPTAHQGTLRFGHQCDTEPGNSGSTIINAQSLKIVGIHNGGEVPWNYATFVAGSPMVEVLEKALSAQTQH